MKISNLFLNHFGHLVFGWKTILGGVKMEINELAKALVAAQSEVENSSKSSTNPHFKSKYSDLAEVLKINGIDSAPKYFDDNIASRFCVTGFSIAAFPSSSS